MGQILGMLNSTVHSQVCGLLQHKSGICWEVCESLFLNPKEGEMQILAWAFYVLATSNQARCCTRLLNLIAAIELCFAAGSGFPPVRVSFWNHISVILAMSQVAKIHPPKTIISL